MRYLSKLLLIVLFSLVFMGCQPEPTPMNPNWPVVLDETLIGKIMVVNSISRKRADNLSEVQFTLKNRLPHSSIDALYQVNWFDKNGFRIKSITDTFMKIHLRPSEEKVYSIISTSQKVLTYKIVIVDYEKNKKRIPNDNIQNDN